MIKKILYTMFVLFLLFLYSLAVDSSAGRLKGKLLSNFKSGQKESMKVPSDDSSQYSIWIKGQPKTTDIQSEINNPGLMNERTDYVSNLHHNKWIIF